MNTQIEDRLTRDLRTAVDDVEASVGFAHRALQSGRRRRRRRTTTCVAGATAVVVGVLVAPGLRSGGGPVADAPAAQDPSAQLEWARSLPRGPVPRVPLWTAEGLRDGSTTVPVPDEVDRSRPPQRVDGGWVVLLHADSPEPALGVLSPDGTLRDLASDPDDKRGDSSAVFVSPDGEEVAYGNRVVELATGNRTRLSSASPLRISGWSSEGLVYGVAPGGDGFGKEWLLRDDGSRVEIGAPGSDLLSYGHGAAGSALTFDLTDSEDACTTVHTLRSWGWDADGTHCMGRPLGAALDLSSDGRWLLTDDFPQVWNVDDGQWVTLDAPAQVLGTGVDASLDGAGWESVDAFLIPVSDEADDGAQTVQIVRCLVGSRTCERAGEEMRVHVDYDAAGEPSPMFAFGGY